MTSNTEMVTISRAEYEAMQLQLQQQVSQLKQKDIQVETLTEALQKKDDELQKKTEELTSAMLQNQWFMERLRLAAKQKFGRSSEQVLDGVMEQLSLLANEAEAWDAASYVPEETKKKEKDSKQKGTRKRRSGSIQDVIPDNLQVEYVHHDLPEEEQNCPICQAKMVQVGVEEHHSLKIIPPQFIHQIDVYHTYSCEECLKETDEALFVKTPKEPTIFPGSFASPEAVAYLMAQKYVMHSPLYRLEQEINRADIKLSRQTMSNWILHCSHDWLKPIYDCMKKKLLEQDVLHADETPVQVLREAGKSAVSKSYMWLYRTDKYAETPIILYDYQPDRKAKRVTVFLGNWSGWLHTDGYSGYHGLPEGIQVVGCWAHARRKFHEAVNSLKKD